MLEEGELHDPQDEDDAESGGSSVLPALAEVHRRAGRAGEAEQVARRALEFEPQRADARVVLALALLDQGRSDAARSVLLTLADTLLARHGLEGPEAPAGEPDDEAFLDTELDQAFASARPEREHMIDADSVAQQAIRSADRELAREFALDASTPFATHTVADLLERQGDPDGARQIREALARPDSGQLRGRQALIAELERWLENLRRPRT